MPAASRRNDTAAGPVSLRLFAEPKCPLECAFRQRPDGLSLRLAVFEEHDQRDRGDAVALREPLLVVDVDLHDLHIFVLVGDPVEHRGDGVAWATPFSPEVDDDLAFRLQDDVLERRIGCFESQFLVSFLRIYT